MTSGKRVTEYQFFRAIQLLRQARRSGRIRRGDIARETGLHRSTLRDIYEQAAIKWLEQIEQAERLDDLIGRGGPD